MKLQQYPTLPNMLSNSYMSHNMTKPTKWLCTQQRLRSAWASTKSDQSSMCTQLVAKDLSSLHTDSEDWSNWADAQADLSLHWAHTQFVGFVMSRLISLSSIFVTACIWNNGRSKHNKHFCHVYMLASQAIQINFSGLHVAAAVVSWSLTALGNPFGK